MLLARTSSAIRLSNRSTVAALPRRAQAAMSPPTASTSSGASSPSGNRSWSRYWAVASSSHVSLRTNAPTGGEDEVPNRRGGSADGTGSSNRPSGAVVKVVLTPLPDGCCATVVKWATADPRRARDLELPALRWTRCRDRLEEEEEEERPCLVAPLPPSDAGGRDPNSTKPLLGGWDVNGCRDGGGSCTKGRSNHPEHEGGVSGSTPWNAARRHHHDAAARSTPKKKKTPKAILCLTKGTTVARLVDRRRTDGATASFLMSADGFVWFTVPSPCLDASNCFRKTVNCPGASLADRADTTSRVSVRRLLFGLRGSAEGDTDPRVFKDAACDHAQPTDGGNSLPALASSQRFVRQGGREESCLGRESSSELGRRRCRSTVRFRYGSHGGL